MLKDHAEKQHRGAKGQCLQHPLHASSSSSGGGNSRVSIYLKSLMLVYSHS
jgi:hypothetical protein